MVELLNNEESNNTDSDSSIQSQEILLSQYPVKPRKDLLPLDGRDHEFSSDDFYGSGEYDFAEVDDSVYYVKQVSLSNKELKDAEQEREELESMCRVRFVF